MPSATDASDSQNTAKPTPPNPPLAVVVGAGPGLGSAVAREFAAHGFRVALVSRSPDGLDLAGMTPAPGGPDVAPILVTADVGDEAAVRDGFALIRRAGGDPAVLIFTVSVFVAGTPTAVPFEPFVGALRDGIGGALIAVQQVAAAMREAHRGTIILTGSAAATKPWVEASAVGVAKAGLRNLGLALNRELAPDGVRVTVLTIDGVIAKGGHFDPALIAKAFWDVHEGAGEHGSEAPAEIIYGPG